MSTRLFFGPPQQVQGCAACIYQRLEYGHSEDCHKGLRARKIGDTLIVRKPARFQPFAGWVADELEYRTFGVTHDEGNA